MRYWLQDIFPILLIVKSGSWERKENFFKFNKLKRKNYDVKEMQLIMTLKRAKNFHKNHTISVEKLNSFSNIMRKFSSLSARLQLNCFLCFFFSVRAEINFHKVELRVLIICNCLTFRKRRREILVCDTTQFPAITIQKSSSSSLFLSLSFPFQSSPPINKTLAHYFCYFFDSFS